MKKNRVLVGISGGVDSAVSAFLLKQQGYEVAGATMVMFGSDDANKQLIEDAKIVANSLNIKHYVLDFRERFKETVVKNFINEYKAGRTPNPCVVCNKYIKYGLFLDYAEKNNFDYIATGHYAKIIYDDLSGEYLLKKADFEEKDQSYVLYNLTQDIMKKIIFPIGKFEKSEIKKIAKVNQLVAQSKQESQDICFIPDGDYVSFLERETHQKSPIGNFVDENGNAYGQHHGFWNYTIGQRKGLSVNFNQKMFVSELNPINNNITLLANDPYSSELLATNINVVSPKRFKDNIRVDAKIRYKHKQKPAVIHLKDDGNVVVIFDEPQRAITKGQSVVFYDGDVVIAGGIIIDTR